MMVFHIPIKIVVTTLLYFFKTAFMAFSTLQRGAEETQLGSKSFQ